MQYIYLKDDLVRTEEIILKEEVSILIKEKI
jgi:hypothetical protein